MPSFCFDYGVSKNTVTKYYAPAKSLLSYPSSNYSIIFYNFKVISGINMVKITICLSLVYRLDLYGPRRDKTCLRGFKQSKTQTSLLSYRD